MVLVSQSPMSTVRDPKRARVMESGSQSLMNSVSDSNKKLFCVGLHALNELHARCPDAKQSDMRVVWFGGGLQGQLPALFGIFPDVHFEMHTHRACPVSDELQRNLNVEYHKSSFEECLSRIEAYKGTQKFAVLLDVDFHIKPSELASNNKANIPVTVESESIHYERYTARYNATCARLARCSHVVLVSVPFRLPWLTSDFKENGHKASWLDAALGQHEIRTTEMLLFLQFGARVNSTELRGLFVVADGYKETVVDWHAFDKEMYGTPTEIKQLLRAKFMLEQLETCQTLTAARRARGNAVWSEWSHAFLRNSIGEVRQIARDLESRNRASVIYKEHKLSEWSGAA